MTLQSEPNVAVEAVNPYAPPQASISPSATDVPDDADVVRRQFLTHEASIHSVGTLYLIGGVLGLILTVFMLFSVSSVLPPEVDTTAIMVGFLVYGLVSAFSFYLGLGLRRLDPQARLGTTILSTIGLIGFPIGTLINGYILYLLHSQKGKQVMTTEYQAIIAETPHIKYRTSPWLIGLALLLISLVVIAVVTAM